MTKEHFRKKWENYWYYYKWQTIIAVFAVLVAAVLVHQCTSRVDPDMTVAVVTKSVDVSQEQCDALAALLQTYTADVNRDGHKSVQVVNYDLSSHQDPQAASALTAKLMAQFQTGDSTVFVTDNAAFTSLQQGGGSVFQNLSSLGAGAPATDRAAVSSLPALKKIFGSVSGKLSVSACDPNSVKAVAAGGNKRVYENAVDVLLRLLKANGAVK